MKIRVVYTRYDPDFFTFQKLMKNIFFILAIAGLVIACGESKRAATIQTHSFPESQLSAVAQITIQNLPKVKTDSLAIPRSLDDEGHLLGVKSRDWTSGFYAGTLWQLYKYSRDPRLKEAAAHWTKFQYKERFDDHTHDLGFKIYCSVGEGYRLLKDEKYRQYIIDASKQLIQRYDEKIGAIRSWDHNRDKWDYPVIIDNMMNLEMLFVAAKLTNNQKFYRVADNHARKTLKHHFREDHSSYHVIDYHTNGDVRKKNTHQGHSHESAWSRGQAWGLYGFTVAYRETRDPVYLQKAEQIANFFFTHPNLPEDLIPYWDFDAPNIPNEPRDASAAAIAASGIIELSQYDQDNAQKYLKWADHVLRNLGSERYQASTPPFLIDHCVGSKPHNSEIDVPLIYADYYYVEALNRRNELLKNGKLDLFLAD